MVGEIEDNSDTLDWKYFASQAGGLADRYPVTELNDGDKAILRSAQNTNYYLTNYVSADGSNNGLQLTDAWQNDAYRWTIEDDNGTLRLTDDDGRYLYIGKNTATMSSSNTNTVALVSNQQYWQIYSRQSRTNYYLNQYGGRR